MSSELTLKLMENEYWWGGVINDGVLMPYGAGEYVKDLSVNIGGNQGVPLLISSKGRYVWSEMPFKFRFGGCELQVAGRGDVDTGEGHKDLRGVYRYASKKYFPPSGTYPDLLLFTEPQYNLWIELPYCPSQQKVLEYARDVVRNGMAPGVIMIDDYWQEYYGRWYFHAGRFPDPKAMVEELHSMGFKVMVWVCPFVSPDMVNYRMLKDKGFLLRDREGRTAIREWWNGYSAVLDCTNPGAVEWIRSELKRLSDEYGIDGFKLDAGDPEYYEDTDLCFKPSNRNDQCKAWAEMGLRYPLNEYRACWKLAGQPLGQRLRDKNHDWREQGLQSLIPNGLAQGLAGYAFNCPDMIGGGEVANFTANSKNLDQELFVRYAQCSALFPMMQFSAAPWRVLDKEHLRLCVEAANLHSRMGGEIAGLVRDAAITGEPIMRHMAYNYPEGGFEKVSDQFMLGDKILVAPVVEKGAVKRTVRFPEGTWSGDDGSNVKGPCEREVDAPLSRLPWYRLA